MNIAAFQFHWRLFLIDGVYYLSPGWPRFIIPPPPSLQGGGGGVAYTDFTLSVCPSVDRTMSALYLQQYLPNPFHICTSLSSNFRRCVSCNVRRQAIIWTSAGILLIGPLGTNFSEISLQIHTFSFKKMHLNMLSAKWQLFCVCLHVLIWVWKY